MYVFVLFSSIEMTSTYLVVFPSPDDRVSSYAPQIVVMVLVPLLVSSSAALIASRRKLLEPARRAQMFRYPPHSFVSNSRLLSYYLYFPLARYVMAKCMNSLKRNFLKSIFDVANLHQLFQTNVPCHPSNRCKNQLIFTENHRRKYKYNK